MIRWPAVYTLAIAICGFQSAVAADFRPPAVPLIVHDPYFSLWSMADHLTDQQTKHWTGTTQSLTSLVRIDGKTYRLMGSEPRQSPALEQRHLYVLPTHTTYEFEGAGVQVTLTFMNPSLPQDLELVSRPVTYLTWAAKAADSSTHHVEIYFDASSQIAVNTADQRVTWSRYKANELTVLRVGSQQQPILEESGDDVRIDWGYLYVVAPPDKAMSQAVTTRQTAIKSFTGTGRAPESDDLQTVQSYGQPSVVLATAFNLEAVSSSPVSKHLALAYDDIFSVSYFERRLRPYWRRNGAEAIDLLTSSLTDYESLEKRSADFDRELMTDLTKAGGEEYASLCALAYSQTLAAHKLVADLDGTPLFLSKENFSNGSIDTVDVTYPSSPFFLLFNTHLLEAQLRPILDYASLPRWPFPFAPHDLGRYPLANGQQYGGGEKTEEDQMPVEESGNMLLMLAAVAQVNGNADLSLKYWPVLTRWAEYLRAKGLDPENQLSTDDFAGHLAHNANLSIKAVLGLAAYGKLARMLQRPDVAKQYTELARGYAQRWQKMDKEGQNYRLAFDRPGTWSQKYNLVWDQLLDLHLFSKEIITTELAFYNTHANTYGVPLDNRADYTKLDWLTWTASLDSSRDGFEHIFQPAYKFANESPSRVPLTDWYDTKTAKQVGFQARSVVGGIFIRMLSDPTIWKKYANAAASAKERVTY